MPYPMDPRPKTAICAVLTLTPPVNAVHSQNDVSNTNNALGRATPFDGGRSNPALNPFSALRNHGRTQPNRSATHDGSRSRKISSPSSARTVISCSRTPSPPEQVSALNADIAGWVEESRNHTQSVWGNHGRTAALRRGARPLSRKPGAPAGVVADRDLRRLPGGHARQPGAGRGGAALWAEHPVQQCQDQFQAAGREDRGEVSPGLPVRTAQQRRPDDRPCSSWTT